MNLTKQQLNILASLASSSRTLNFFTHNRETPIFKLTLTKLVNLGYVYQDDGDKYYITTKGRQAFDTPGGSSIGVLKDWRNSFYKTGDGDVISARRPGSMDAFSLPSGGLSVQQK